MYNIDYSINHFTIEFDNESYLNINKESAIRGIIGQILLLNHCIKDKNCSTCDFKENCVAANFLEMKLKYDLFFLASKYVPTYVIICDEKKTKFNAGDTLSFSILSFSQGIILIPEIIRSMTLAGNTLGLNNNKFKLKQVLNDRNKAICNYDKLYLNNINIRKVSDYIENRLSISDEISTMKLLRPLRFKKEGKFATDLTEDDLIDLLKRRILTLNALQGNKVDQNKEYHMKITYKDLTWSENKRYSNKQNTSMKFGGMIGRIDIETEDLETKKLLIAGELLNIGKNTSFGLGDYILY